MKKQLPEESITNELRGRSAFFRRASVDEAPSSPVTLIDASRQPATQSDDSPVPAPSTPVKPIVAEQNVRLLDSQKSNNLTSQSVSMSESQHVRMLDFVRFFLVQKNETLSGFRYPQALIDKLDQLEFELKKKSGKRVPRTTIVVTAVAQLLWEYDLKGEESLLAQILKEQL